MKHKPLTFEGGVRYVESLVPETQDQFDAWFEKELSTPCVRNLMVGVDMFGNARYADGMVHDEGKSNACLISMSRRSAIEKAIWQALADAYGEGVHDGMNK